MKAEPPEKKPLTPEPPRPTSPDLEPLKVELRAIVAEQCDRLSGLLEQHEAGQSDDVAESVENAECAAFDDSPEGDRLHRYQAHWSRSLLRTLDAIHRQGNRGGDGEPEESGNQEPCRCDRVTVHEIDVIDGPREPEAEVWRPRKRTTGEGTRGRPGDDHRPITPGNPRKTGM